MCILKLKPSCKDYIWGGRRLAEEYNISYDGDILAEAWMLSCHPDGPSVIENGAYAGKTLSEYIQEEGRQKLGVHSMRFRDFPILAKLIDAKENLSIQVHPDNQYALKHEGQYGKTEMWYVVDAKEGAYLYYGFKKEISRKEFEQRIKDDSLLEVLNKVPVRKGDVLFIESGTIHAIGRDILIAEIQQNSNVTYRVYDYGRVGKDGKKRDLHIEKALAVTNRVPIMKSGDSYPHVADCDYFTVDKLNLDGKVMDKMEGEVTEESFVSLLILDGEGTVSNEKEQVSYKKGDSLFLPAGSGRYQIEGTCDALVTTIRDKAAPIRIGIHISAAKTKIGLVDAEQKLLAWTSIPTELEKTPEEMIAVIGEKTKELMEEEGITFDRCIGAGVGVPGTIERRRGEVLYSNNIRWEQVELAKGLAEYLPVPIAIANDADCAVLGEAADGAAQGYQDVVMITLGAGVGGGVLLDGRIFEGRRAGGSELGHMVIAEHGRPCTCGRKGCLEAYVSAAALKKEAERVLGRPASPDEVFALARQGEEKAKTLVEDYIEKLGTGLVNISNIFQPQILLIGGEFSGQEEIIKPLRDILAKECFGGNHTRLPEIQWAKLNGAAAMVGAANLV